MDTEGIRTWRDLIDRISGLDENEIKGMLNYEIVKYNRKTIVLRLHQRYCGLRRDREREEMAQGRIIL